MNAILKNKLIRIISFLVVIMTSFAFVLPSLVDWAMVARIREEGLQHSKVMEYESYIVDVLGARLTLSKDMQHAQVWALDEMKKMGLSQVNSESYMDYGVTWDNEYVSVHMLAPDYSPLTAYPVAYTASSKGKVNADAIIVDLQTKDDMDALRGKLSGKAVLISNPVAIDLQTLTNGVHRYNNDELISIEQTTIVPIKPKPARVISNPTAITAVERIAFLKSENVAVVLQTDGNRLGIVPAYSRPGVR
ncbi:MAG: hypothetical protein RIR64_1048, partial [Bacteroidota bacterium]